MLQVALLVLTDCTRSLVSSPTFGEPEACNHAERPSLVAQKVLPVANLNVGSIN